MKPMTILLGIGAAGLLFLRKKPTSSKAATWRLLRVKPEDIEHITPGDVVTLRLEVLHSNGSKAPWDMDVLVEKNKGDCSVFKADKDCLHWAGKIVSIFWPADFYNVFYRSQITPPLPVVGERITFETDHVFAVS